METITARLLNIFIMQVKIRTMIGAWLKYKDYGGGLERNDLDSEIYFRRWSLGMFLLKIKIFSFLVLTHVTVSRLGPVKK